VSLRCRGSQPSGTGKGKEKDQPEGVRAFYGERIQVGGSSSLWNFEAFEAQKKTDYKGTGGLGP